MGRGSLRIYLGASPGVGKTYAMLAEGARRAARGTDVVVGFVETHGRKHTAAQIGTLEVIPRVAVSYRGTMLYEMDVAAILARRPTVVLVDEYAHTNAPGSGHDKRWQDVEQILDAGIDVISTLNIQHLESLSDVVYRITGVLQRETVPDSVVRRAEQIELVDMSPEAIRRRMAHGNIYPAEKVDAALSNYFRPGNLGALRELALLWLADRVEESISGYLQAHGIAETWETRERVVVVLSSVDGSERVVRRAARLASRNRGELIGVHIAIDDGRPPANSAELAAQRQLVTELGGTCYEAVGDDAAETLARFARREKATQVVLGATHRSRMEELLRGSTIGRITRLLGDIDVHVIATKADAVRRSRPSLQGLGVRRRRQVAAWMLLLTGLPALTAALVPLRAHTNLSTLLLLELCLVLGVAVLGGTLVALVAAVAASLVTNWFFVPPHGTLTIAQPENVVALVVFLVVAVAVGALVDVVTRRSSEARRARLEAEALTRAATSLAVDPQPVPALLEQIASTFDLRGVRLVPVDPPTGDDTVPEVDGLGSHTGDTTGVPVASIELATAVGPDARLELFGSVLSGDAQRLLGTLADQLTIALDAQELARTADTASKLAEVDAVRTGMLRAVSHDLRTPLASIKTMVTGVLDAPARFSEAQLRDALTTVDEETDRLTRLVENLLDASRLQSGALAVSASMVDVLAVIDRAVNSLGGTGERIDIDVADDAALAWADHTLLERAIANLATNAVRFSPDGCLPHITAERVGGRVAIRVVDYGPGIDIEHRDQVIAPFQRVGDQQPGTGVGLGMSISQGFISAMGGELILEDTPGGGLTASVMLLAAPPADAG